MSIERNSMKSFFRRMKREGREVNLELANRGYVGLSIVEVADDFVAVDKIVYYGEGRFITGKPQNISYSSIVSFEEGNLEKEVEMEADRRAKIKLKADEIKKIEIERKRRADHRGVLYLSITLFIVCVLVFVGVGYVLGYIVGLIEEPYGSYITSEHLKGHSVGLAKWALIPGIVIGLIWSGMYFYQNKDTWD